MDIQMPEMDGFAVLELLRRSNLPQARAIPVIALTARMDDEREYLARGLPAASASLSPWKAWQRA